MHDVAGEIACAEGCAETISANVLKVPVRSNFPKFMFVHFLKDYVAVIYQAK